MGKLHSKGLPVYGERERMTERGRFRKAPSEISKAGDCSFPNQAQKETVRPYINHSNRRN